MMRASVLNKSSLRHQSEIRDRKTDQEAHALQIQREPTPVRTRFWIGPGMALRRRSADGPARGHLFVGVRCAFRTARRDRSWVGRDRGRVDCARRVGFRGRRQARVARAAARGTGRLRVPAWTTNARAARTQRSVGRRGCAAAAISSGGPQHGASRTRLAC